MGKGDRLLAVRLYLSTARLGAGLGSYWLPSLLVALCENNNSIHH